MSRSGILRRIFLLLITYEPYGVATGAKGDQQGSRAVPVALYATGYSRCKIRDSRSGLGEACFRNSTLTQLRWAVLPAPCRKTTMRSTGQNTISKKSKHRISGRSIYRPLALCNPSAAQGWISGDYSARVSMKRTASGSIQDSQGLRLLNYKHVRQDRSANTGAVRTRPA